MIVYWSMMLWVPIIYFIYSAVHSEEIMLADYNIRKGLGNKIPVIYCLIVFGYFIFWTGMRTYYADTSLYIFGFEGLTTDFSEGLENINWDGKSPGFDLFNLFFKCYISEDFQWWLMCIATISGLCVMHTLRKYSVDFFLSSFMFIALIQFTWLMNGMRQFICVAIIFVCTDLLKEGKLVKYIILILLLTTIHFSALMMIPMYFVARSKPWSEKTLLFISCMVILSTCANTFFNGVLDTVGGEAYENYTIPMGEYDDGVNPIRAVFHLIPPLLALWKKKSLSEYYDAYPLLPISINMSLATFGWYFIGMFSSGILIGRLPIYCDLYNLLLIPFIFKLGFEVDDKSSNEENTKSLLVFYAVKVSYILIMVCFFYLLMHNEYYISDITGLVK